MGYWNFYKTKTYKQDLEDKEKAKELRDKPCIRSFNKFKDAAYIAEPNDNSPKEA